MKPQIAIATAAIVAAVFLSAIFLIYDTVITIVTAIVYVVAGATVLSAICIVLFVVAVAWERWKTERAKRKAKERDSEVLVVTTQDGQVHIRETNKHVDWRAAHVDQRVYANSKASYAPPKTHETDAWRWWNQPKTKTQVIEGQLGQSNIMLPNLIEVIRDEPCVMIWGGRDAGKTNTALHWVANRSGVIVICDPKPANKNPWATNHIFGTGGDYEEIQQTVYRYRAELRRRVKQQILDAPELTIFVDELFLLVDVHELDIMMPIFEIITTGRDYRMHAGFTTSDKGVDSLKIKGKSGLREALTVIEVRKTGHKRQVFVDLGNGQQEYTTPGQYSERGGTLALPAHIEPTEQPRTPQQRELLTRWQRSRKTEAEFNSIVEDIYGHGGGQRKRAKETIERYG